MLKILKTLITLDIKTLVPMNSATRHKYAVTFLKFYAVKKKVQIREKKNILQFNYTVFLLLINIHTHLSLYEY